MAALLSHLNAVTIDQGRDFGIHIGHLIAHLEKNVGLAPLAKPAPAKSIDVVELARWDAIKDTSDPDDLRDYVARYPDGNLVDLAEKRLALLEEKEWKVASSLESISALEQFLRFFPARQFAETARSSIESTKARIESTTARVELQKKEDERWQRIQDAYDAAELRNFLSEFPRSKHAYDARKLAVALDNGLLRTLIGHSKAITSLSISVDRKIILSGSNDATVKRWNVATCR